MNRKMTAVTLVAALAIVPATFAAEETKKVEAKHEMSKASSSQGALEKEAKISMAEARKIALNRAHGTIESGELEREKGKLIYSFDIRVPHKNGITEVAVDAITGNIIEVKHETPAKESAEKKQEAKEKTTAATATDH